MLLHLKQMFAIKNEKYFEFTRIDYWIPHNEEWFFFQLFLTSFRNFVAW